MMVRLAGSADAEQLLVLNEQFNGKNCTTVENIRQSLSNNAQEIVAVAEEDGILAGFVCAQVKKSFCYKERYAEISEVFVNEAYRRRKIASSMILFVEEYCMQHYEIYNFELQTGEENLGAQALYRAIGYKSEHEILLRKRVRGE